VGAVRGPGDVAADEPALLVIAASLKQLRLLTVPQEHVRSTCLVESAWARWRACSRSVSPGPLAEPAVPISRQRGLRGVCR
jgi:hypothetical protein